MRNSRTMLLTTMGVALAGGMMTTLLASTPAQAQAQPTVMKLSTATINDTQHEWLVVGSSAKTRRAIEGNGEGWQANGRGITTPGDAQLSQAKRTPSHCHRVGNRRIAPEPGNPGRNIAATGSKK